MDLFGINWYCMIAYLLLFQSFLRFCAIVLLICVFQVPCCIWWWLGNSRIVICNNSDFSQPVHCKHLNLIKSEYGFQPTPWWTSVRQQVPHTSKPSHCNVKNRIVENLTDRWFISWELCDFSGVFFMFLGIRWVPKRMLKTLMFTMV